ncbi:M55 family metallopeptidase [Clostridium algidicarnis]|uniref:D-amino peptidase n=2 Tax=Clostridium algidicarnis TaxID=37659 RepID=A0A2S6FU91_9CLOT|nr:M55 family metallopeptidase [Clostridium algidicarnis]MBU3221135.1 M55 family metallopeptidase [Clostridium algidicarnis]PPK42903.1 D-amino peptidase [Clostridium algidicarnis DSM 15099]
MKIYISADIEGITGVTSWSETEKGHSDFESFAQQMTKEVRAAAEGAFEAGATEIYVKDAHDSARNIDINELPEYVTLQSGWSGDPMCMVSGLDSSFDAALFIGYHSRAGSGDSPLAHTMDTSLEYIKINGVYVSEFLINSYAAALHGVPVVFVSGDKGLSNEVRDVNPKIATFSVKEGIGKSVISIHPRKAIKEIKSIVTSTLKSDYSLCKVELPETFDVEIAYQNHEIAYKNSFYPRVELLSSKAIGYKSDDYYEVLRMFNFLT